MTRPELRIGALGAARITPMALIRPAGQTTGVSVTALAARNRVRAERFARKHGVARGAWAPAGPRSAKRHGAAPDRGPGPGRARAAAGVVAAGGRAPLRSKSRRNFRMRLRPLL